MEPLISVIVPVYNVEDYIEYCVKSLVYQSYENLEIILVNDGSTDLSGDICNAFGKSNKKIKVIHKENGGLSSARNAGMEVASGNFIAFVDSDDHIHPDTYKLCVGGLNIFSKEISYVEFGYKKTYSTEVKCFPKITSCNYKLFSKKETIKNIIHWSQNTSLAWNKLFPREFIMKYRFQPGKVNEDEFFTNEYLNDIQNVVYIPADLYYYYQREGSIMNQPLNPKRIEGFYAQVERYELLKSFERNLASFQLKSMSRYLCGWYERILNERYDKNGELRYSLCEMILPYQQEIIESSFIEKKHKDYIQLALAIQQSRNTVFGYRDKYQGRRCFIIGNGPSLISQDLEKLSDEITFASHRIYKLFDTTQWRPTYYFVQDSKLLAVSENEISQLEVKKKFIFQVLGCNYIHIDASCSLKLNTDGFYPDLPKFSENLIEGVYEGFTVSYAMLQMAIWMGFEEIILLGIDHSYSVDKLPDGTIVKNKNERDHFDVSDVCDNFPQTSKSTLAYEKAKRVAQRRGVQIYNATRGGQLEVFSRIDFDLLFE